MEVPANTMEAESEAGKAGEQRLHSQQATFEMSIRYLSEMMSRQLDTRIWGSCGRFGLEI